MLFQEKLVFPLHSLHSGYLNNGSNHMPLEQYHKFPLLIHKAPCILALFKWELSHKNPPYNKLISSLFLFTNQSMIFQSEPSRYCPQRNVETCWYHQIIWKVIIAIRWIFMWQLPNDLPRGKAKMEFQPVRTQAFQVFAIEFYVFFVLGISCCDHSQSVQLIWWYRVQTFWNIWNRFSLWIVAIVLSMVPACGLPICWISLHSIQAHEPSECEHGKGESTLLYQFIFSAYQESFSSLPRHLQYLTATITSQITGENGAQRNLHPS